jgi:hypothetical protein
MREHLAPSSRIEASRPAMQERAATPSRYFASAGELGSRCAVVDRLGTMLASQVQTMPFDAKSLRE